MVRNNFQMEIVFHLAGLETGKKGTKETILLIRLLT